MPYDAFQGLEPAALWRHFAEFTRIARPPGQETGMVHYVRTLASEHGLEVSTDAIGNVRVRVRASAGRESKPRVVLQGHLDMVCTRDVDAGEFDPALGKIRVFRAREEGNEVVEDPSGEWLKAFRTTLGADNGVGVAALLAIATDGTILHGPLDLLLTVQEEAGLVGAIALDPSLINAGIVLNVDSEEDGVFTIGSAGGRETHIAWTRSPVTGSGGAIAYRVSVAGLLGGHSGVDINKGRLNAIRALTRLLHAAANRVPLRLVSVDGGDRSNAIPRESHAVVVLAPTDDSLFRDSIGAASQELRKQFGSIEVDIRVTVDPVSVVPSTALTPERSRALLDVLRAIPTGVVAMSQDIAGLVETSNNLGVVATTPAAVAITCNSRSAVDEALADVTASLTSIAAMSEAAADPKPAFPGWKPQPNSATLGTMRETYRELFGQDSHVAAVHAGLECGVINSKVPDLDIVSFGPTIVGAHSTRERVHIDSVGRFYRLLAAALQALSS